MYIFVIDITTQAPVEVLLEASWGLGIPVPVAKFLVRVHLAERSMGLSKVGGIYGRTDRIHRCLGILTRPE